jgi:hypothetical protein
MFVDVWTTENCFGFFDVNVWEKNLGIIFGLRLIKDEILEFFVGVEIQTNLENFLQVI